MKPFSKIAVCHPGKIGDALYTLPTIQAIAPPEGVDFYTSSHCAPLRRLMEAQPCINQFIIPESYVIRSMDCGVQPWFVPVCDTTHYEKVYQLGFRGCPAGPLPDYIARMAGVAIPPVPKLNLECPPLCEVGIQGSGVRIADYVVLASRHPTSYDTVFQEFMDLCPVPVVQVGAAGQCLPGHHGRTHPRSVDLTGCDLLEMASLIKHSRGFVGLMSAPLVVANAFDVPKVAPHDGIHWDMSHVLRGPFNHYPINPSARQILDLFGI